MNVQVNIVDQERSYPQLKVYCGKEGEDGIKIHLFVLFTSPKTGILLYTDNTIPDPRLFSVHGNWDENLFRKAYSDEKVVISG
jgi:hypothetical protein